ncbi:glycerophosphodiester phosphodiesterase family protein [Helcococcus kunzii]|uniref:glycerophosphodiester phosphodiesterase family protein n=1 Tax=Helcococcus kunzii TaxID=40091 RepID=UPI00389EA0BE
MKNRLLEEKLKNNSLLIACHRGFYGANIIQNTIESSKLALKAGVDIVEIDVCRSSDGKYYIFHDGNEKQLFNIDKNFSELSSHEIDNLEFYNTIGTLSGKKINTLEEYLEWIPDNALVNIDRSWNYWDDEAFIDIIDNCRKTENLLFKSSANILYLEKLKNFKRPLYYFPIIYSEDDFERVLQFDYYNLVGAEMIITGKDSDLYNLSSNSKLFDFQLRMINSETLGKGFNLFLNLSDDEAVLGNEEAVWGKMLELGANCIQTDWPNFIDEFRNLKYKK